MHMRTLFFGSLAAAVLANQPAGVKIEAPAEVAEHKLVFMKVTGPHAGGFDISIITTIDNQATWVEATATSVPGEYVFTGPPGVYSIRAVQWDKEAGQPTRPAVATVKILGDAPTKPPPAAGPFNDISRKVTGWVQEHCSADFPRAKLAGLYNQAADKLKANPPALTHDSAEDWILDRHDSIFNGTHDLEWNRRVLPKINEVWSAFDSESTTNSRMALFFEEIAKCLSAMPQ